MPQTERILELKQFIVTEINTQINLNEQVTLFGLSCKEPYTKDKRDKINLDLLIARLSFSKFIYGETKILEVISDSELKLRNMKQITVQ